MQGADFERARSTEAKGQRERAILDAARDLGRERGIRAVTLTDIAGAIGMHKSALLRYFETREQIFLKLSAIEWNDWGPDVVARLAKTSTPEGIAAVFAHTLAERPFFCDLQAQVPLNLERNVSIDSVRDFKLVTHAHVNRIIGALRRQLPALSEQHALDIIATATSMAGAQWQMANPGPEVTVLYRSDPRLAHAIVDVEPRLRRVLTALIIGFL